jgi:branched chain amino acid efflux pump
MSDVWLTVWGLMVTTAVIKASGPMVLGGRDLPAWSRRLIALLAPAVLSALVVTQTFGDPDGSLVLDERAAGVLGAAAVLLLRGPVLLAIVTAAAVAAAVHAI